VAVDVAKGALTTQMGKGLAPSGSPSPPGVAAACGVAAVAAIIVLRHRGNIARLRSGEEPLTGGVPHPR